MAQRGERVTRILVPFQGEGSGVDNMTWGQLGIWQSIQQTGQSRTVDGISTLAAGATIANVADSLAFIMGRHQSLRTRLLFDGAGLPRQSCAASGEAPLEIVDIEDGDPAEVAAAVHDRYRRKHFDYENEWPVRMAAIRNRGVPTHVVAVYLHLTIDAMGLDVLVDDLARYRATGEAPPVTAMQPLEQARRQQSPAGQRQCAAGLRHLENTLRTVPASRFGLPRYGSEPGFVMIRYRSPATLLAAQAVAARGAVNTSGVLLAGFAVALARQTGSNPVMAILTVSNRFRPGFSESVSAIAQITPFMIDVGGVSLDGALTRTAQSTLHAYKNAYCDPYQQDDVVARVNRERGEDVDLSCYYNDRRLGGREELPDPPPTADQIRTALRLSEAAWVEDPEMPGSKVYLYVYDAPDAVEFKMSVDTRYFAPSDLESLVRGMEAVTVEMALDPSAPTGVPAVDS